MVDADPVAACVRDIMAERSAWTGSAADLLRAQADFAADGFIALLNLTAYISVAVGFANLLPIPVLDGGHLLYYGFEAILGRPLGERAQEVGFRLGLAFVLFLMLLTTFNDLVRFNLF